MGEMVLLPLSLAEFGDRRPVYSLTFSFTASPGQIASCWCNSLLRLSSSVPDGGKLERSIARREVNILLVGKGRM